MECGNYRCIKLMEIAFEDIERVIGDESGKYCTSSTTILLLCRQQSTEAICMQLEGKEDAIML